MTYLVAMTKNADDTLRRTEGRKRLRALADAAMPARTKEQAELERLREYLVMWARAEKSETEQLGAPGAVSFIDNLIGVDGYTEGQDYDERLDRWAREIINTSIDDLLELPEGDLMRAALRVRYLNEGLSREAGMQIRVFRHRRLEDLTLLEADELADRAELALIQPLRRRGLAL